MKRRNLLMALPLTGIAAIPSLVKADLPDTPILKLFREHRAIIAAADEYVLTTG